MLLRRSLGSRWAARPLQPFSGRASTRSAASASGSPIFSYPLASPPTTLYEHPELYEAVFSYRDMKQEVEFLRDLYAKHAKGAPLNAVIELGCGPASHAIGLSRAGVPRVTGLDLSDEMLKFARWKYDATGGAGPSAQRAAAAASAAPNKSGKGFAAASPASPVPFSLSFVCADMTDWALGPTEPPLDMAVCMLGTFLHCLDNESACAAFGCASKALRPGGLFVLELSHPGDLFDGTFIIGDGGKEVWEVPAGTDHKILVEWGADFDNFDPVTQVVHRTVSVNVLRGDEVESSMEEIVMQRQFTVQEIRLMASMHGFVVESFFGDTSLDVDLSHEDAFRMIAVLRKG
ncbi:hypothetical protein FOA52_012364 [Chlamydomonas sp. UWO 241]|nr:hypothetical protein FOA52_012364 [Chlamydomonas sp. UWO 241]